MAHIAEQIEVGKRIVGNIQMHLPEAFGQKRPVLQVNGFDNIHKINYKNPFVSDAQRFKWR